MKKKFLAVYDYGTGGIWRVISAESKADITAKFPQLVIFDFESPPEWLKKEWLGDIERGGVVHIEGPYDEFLSGLLEGKV